MIDEIAQTLETHSQAPRVRKLVFAVLNNRWENDLTVLDRQSLSQVLLLVCQRFPDLGQLQVALGRVVEALNKKSQYVPVAELIIEQLRSLYTAPQQPDLQNFPWFDLRWQILKVTHPLRAKILLFSLVHHPFTHSEADWINLKLLSLGDLLKQVLERYTTLLDLTLALKKSAASLQEASEYAMVAQTLLQVLETSWNFAATSPEEPPTGEISYLAEMPAAAYAADEDLTCQFFPADRKPTPPPQ